MLKYTSFSNKTIDGTPKVSFESYTNINLKLDLFPEGDCDLLRDSVHVTSAAARPNNELWCYKCLAEVPDDRCADLRHNNSALIHKCHNDRRMCMVRMTMIFLFACEQVVYLNKSLT